jgi:hypothetical protein
LVRRDAGIVMLQRLLRSADDTVTLGGSPPLAFGHHEVIDTSATVPIGADPDFVAPEPASI